MATKRKKSTHRRKHHRRKGIFGIGAAGGAAERLVGGLVGAGLTRMLLNRMDDERSGPLIAVAVGGFIAWNYPEGLINGIGLGAMVEGALNFGERHMPWMRGISEDTIEKISLEVDKMKQLTLGASENKQVYLGSWGSW